VITALLGVALGTGLPYVAVASGENPNAVVVVLGAVFGAALGFYLLPGLAFAHAAVTHGRVTLLEHLQVIAGKLDSLNLAEAPNSSPAAALAEPEEIRTLRMLHVEGEMIMAVCPEWQSEPSPADFPQRIAAWEERTGDALEAWPSFQAQFQTPTASYDTLQHNQYWLWITARMDVLTRAVDYLSVVSRYQ